jgi:uncharacterized protein (DUF924 family)
VSVTPREVLDFWFKDSPPEAWFRDDPAFDEIVGTRFGDVVVAAREGKLDDWMETGEGTLALLILLDQFPRNIFRGRADAFASDAKAREVARCAITKGFDVEVPKTARSFFYLPFMHSEDIGDQDWSVAFIGERVGEDSLNYPYALKHRDVIRRFGRFPARNIALNRSSTSDELAFLAEGRGS